MKRMQKFLRLPAGDRRLLILAFCALAECQIRLRFQSVERWQAWATRAGVETGNKGRIVWAVQSACRIFPRSSTCLVRALALQHLLARHGHPAQLHIGVGVPDGRFAAHAWLADAEDILIGGGNEAENFALLTTWHSADGAELHHRKAPL